jgi:hypothetical protein
MYKTKSIQRKRHRKHHRGTKKMRGEKKCEATMAGITQWYVSVFEKLGWMVLAKNKGYNDKIETYKNSLRRMKECIENKLVSVVEEDRKADLRIMHHNLLLLIDHVNKDFA